jgi:hypothetical protein
MSEIARCPWCGGDGGDNWFDRSICAEPCGKMHTRCRGCGGALDECHWEDEPPPENVRQALSLYDAYFGDKA